MAVDRHKVENFLYREARLMDEHAYDEWLALWTDDALYWVPCNEDDTARLKSGAAYAQDPKSRLSRIVSNVEIEAENKTETIVRSSFNVTALRRGRVDIFAGRAIHKLRPEGDSFKIAHKKVLLINNDVVIHNLTFLI
jgi:3-phenylpropionate/cinnamic acid dioxygenase small subunit